MKSVIVALALLLGAATPVPAQDGVPDLKGTWNGKGKTLVLGNNTYHPGTQTVASPPRVRNIDVTYIVDGQEGRLAWGHASSSVAPTKEPFAWAIAADNKSIMGADVDGYYHMTLTAPDTMDKCYVQNATSPSNSIIATCYGMRKVSK
jgi:hypothetical protein